MLGWGDMLAQVAIPACEEILEHITIDEASKMTANRIFGVLGGSAPEEDILSLISLRAEIEYEMRHGVNHWDAISEWWK
jgi:hypothetical protein